MIETVSTSMPWIGLILGYGFLTHGIILFNDGLYWDGWMLEVWQKNRDRNSMHRFFSEVGMPNLYFEHRFGIPTSEKNRCMEFLKSEVGMPNLYFEHWILGRFPRHQIAYRV